MTTNDRFDSPSPRRVTRRMAISAGSALAAALTLAAAGNGIARAGSDATPATVGTPGSDATPGSNPAGSTPTTGDRPKIVVRVEYVGGFTPPANSLLTVPFYQLTDDGQEITQGPQILIFPPPALPNLLLSRLTDTGIQGVLDAAAAAGLVGQDQEYRNDQISDLQTMVITIVSEGVVTRTSAYGLDMLYPAATGDLADARDRIQGFLSVIQDPARLQGGGAEGESEATFAEEQMQVVAVPAAEIIPPEEAGTVQGSDPIPPIEWPLDAPLADIGIPLVEAVGGENFEGIFPGARVQTLSGDDLAAIRPLAETANQLSVWSDGGEEWVLLLRPLLPGELADLARPAGFDGD